VPAALRVRLFVEAGRQWYRHNAPRLGASLAYYTVFSLAPTLVILVAICGRFFGDEAVRRQVYWEIHEVAGEQSATVILSLLGGARSQRGLIASLLGLLTLLIGASGVFVELRDTLNYIWEAPPRRSSGWRTALQDRIFSVAIVFGIGVLLAISILAGAVFQALKPELAVRNPVPAMTNGVVTFLITALLFAIIYRVIPDVHVEWADVAIGSLITALLFAFGRFLIGLYLSEAAVGSAYGAAGSLVALLAWVYYSAQIFLYGAEITHVYARSRRTPGARTR
jgi:membrane protein